MFTGTFMRSLIAKGVILTMAASTLAMANPRSTGEWFNGSVRLMGGAMLMDIPWRPDDNHGQFGLLIDYLPDGFPMHVVADVISTGSSGERLGCLNYSVSRQNWCWTSTSQVNAGVRKHVSTGAVRSYAGAGIGFLEARQQFGVHNNWYSNSRNQNTFNLWANAGAAIMLHEHINAGLDVRYNYANIAVRYKNNDRDTHNVGGLGAGFFLGYQW